MMQVDVISADRQSADLAVAPGTGTQGGSDSLSCSHSCS